MRWVCVAVVVCLVVACESKNITPPPSPPKLLVDILKVAGKPQEKVEKILGKPASCEKTNPSRVGEVPACSYAVNKDVRVEIVYISGMADWITVEGIEDLPFAASSLAAIGLSVKPPDFSNDIYLNWKGLHGFLEVSLFQGRPGKLHYAYIKGYTD